MARRGEKITIFDGTKLAPQDLVAASLIIAAAIKSDGAQIIFL